MYQLAELNLYDSVDFGIFNAKDVKNWSNVNVGGGGLGVPPLCQFSRPIHNFLEYRPWPKL